MKKKLIILVIFIVILGVVLVGCSSSELTSPRDLKVKNGVFSWNAVEGADGYLVYFNDYVADRFFVSGTSFEANNENIQTSLISGQVNYMWVRAITLDKYGQPDIMSDRSRLDFNYSRKLDTPKNLKARADGTIEWRSVDGAQEYVAMVKMTDGSLKEHKIVAKQGTVGMTGTIKGLAKGTYELYIVARSTGYSDSDATATITFEQLEDDIEEGEPINGWTVTFDMNYEGSTPITAFAEDNRSVSRPEDPTRDGYTFSGWYFDSYCLVEAGFTSKNSKFNVTANTTVYAKWVEKPVVTYPLYVYSDNVTILSGDLYKGDELFRENVLFTVLRGSANWFTVKVDEGVTRVVVKSGLDTVATVAFDKDKPYYKDGESFAEKPADPIIPPQFGVIVKVNGSTVYNLIKNEAPEAANVTSEYYGTFNLNKGDSIEIIDTDGFEYLNYEPTCGFTGIAKVSGEYTVYAKKYDDDGHSIWVSVPEDTGEDSTTVYFYNYSNWDEVYIYIWDGTKNGENWLIQWPGRKIDAVEGHDGWYTAKIPNGFGNVIFNGGIDKPQTTDLTLDPDKPYYNGYMWVDGFDTTSRPPEGETTEKTKIYFYNDKGWTDVYAYAWGSGNNSWPGEKMTKVEGHDGWYVIELEVHKYSNIIFDKGLKSGSNPPNDQTYDLTMPKDDAVYYKNGQWVYSME